MVWEVKTHLQWTCLALSGSSLNRAKVWDVSCQRPDSLNSPMFSFLFCNMGIEIVPNYRISARRPDVMGVDASGAFCAGGGGGVEWLC